ncbi:hypothetical protein [Thiolapillus brandeum]|uniref:Lytic murein transglycosylase n=1 Tax=Thiolapillus brandeum TaxID=1076588 RepID=A0A7U6JHL1_9GAMM|nr:hypothetical protein [Thiolapillus brandeum]BAO44589.1 conserved hypothetical protein [Thiolapillus brandeum]
MGDHIFLKVLGVTLLLIVAALLIPAGQPPEEYRNLPWQIEVMDDGSSRVFGVHLGASTLDQVEQQFQEPSEVSMFATDDGERVVEAFFNSVTLSGLKSKIVATLGFSDAQLQAMFDRGERISTLAQGKRKISLSGQDMQLTRMTPVVALTYLPRVNLQESVVIKRFGQPAEKIAEAGGQKEHWLYPDKGLDVVMDKNAKEVLQYVAPRDFEQLRRPLLEHASPEHGKTSDQG